MTDVAQLISDMVKQGVSAELVGRVAAALAEREVVAVQVKDEAADRRRAADRERKRNVRGNPQNSPDGGGNGSPSPDGPSPFPHTPNPHPLNPPSTPTDKGGTGAWQESHLGEVIPLRPEPKPPPEKRAHRLPSDFQLTQADITHARNEGLTDDQIRREFDRFRDHWLAASGSNAAKRDWHAAWRNWVRKAADRVGAARSHAPDRHGQQAGGILGAYQRAAARFHDPNDVPERPAGVPGYRRG